MTRAPTPIPAPDRAEHALAAAVPLLALAALIFAAWGGSL